MSEIEKHLEYLHEIRGIMERQTKFLSLSGLSGIFAGIFALCGAAVLCLYLDCSPIDNITARSRIADGYTNWGMSFTEFLMLDAGIVLILSLVGAYFFTNRRSQNNGERLWNKVSMRLGMHLFFPLLVGGVVCLVLLTHGMSDYISGMTLIFYGFGLLNASRYTHKEIGGLGVAEICLGLLAIIFLGYGLAFWIIGFGILHMIYGTIMYFRYEKKDFNR